MASEESTQPQAELLQPAPKLSSNCKLSPVFPNTSRRLKSELKVCADDADVSFLSSDSVVFRIHSTNLNAICGGFPPVGIKAEESEKVPLVEDSKTLEMLFVFIYPRRHPDLTNIPFELLSRIAEAVEKYQVFSAMNTCKSRMREWASHYPLDVFGYAYRHDYEDVMAATIPHLHELSLREVVGRLPMEMTAAWVEYHLMWTEKFKSTYTADSKKYGVKFIAKPPGTFRKIATKTHLDEDMMANALLSLTKRCPDALSKGDALETIRAALDSAGHMDPDGLAAQESYHPSNSEMFKNSVEVFMAALENNLSTLPSFHEYLKSRKSTIG